MERYFTKLSSTPTQQNVGQSSTISSKVLPNPPNLHSSVQNDSSAQNDYSNLEIQSDPALRKSILSYDSNKRENVRRAYLQKGPCQPKTHDFPWTGEGKNKRRFVSSWFNEYNGWLEYSISKDASFCLYCFLFKPPQSGEQGGIDTFVVEGFGNWKKKSSFDKHVGDHNSLHSACQKYCEDLMNQKQHIETCLYNHSDQTRVDYRARLIASINCLRFLLRQGMALRGHNESEESANGGNFLELLEFHAKHNEEVKRVVLKNAPENLKLTSPKIQHDIVNSFAKEIANIIIKEIGGGFFSILVDEARDVSVKEQMAVVLRFVDKKGFLIERFIGIVHVKDTTALSLKEVIEALFSNHGLRLSSLRGQGYDGASNMSGEFNGLKTLILMDNPCAYYVHCFAHQLQLILVAVVRDHSKVCTFFEVVKLLTNIVGASCKRRDILRDKQFEKVIEGIASGEILTGCGLNQETTLKRAGDTCWGSHYGTLLSLIDLFSSIVDVLLIVGADGKDKIQKSQADNLAEHIQSFEFVFILHLMKKVLGITNELSQALQKKDQDIVNAIHLVKLTKNLLQEQRDNGWESLLNVVNVFCAKHKISIIDMGDSYVQKGRSRRNADVITYLHYYHVEIFYAVIDLLLGELDSRFNEVNMELLLCMDSLDPRNSFAAFDKSKLIKFAEFYPSNFSSKELIALDHQLDNYVSDMRSDDRVNGITGVTELCRTMVRLKKHDIYPLIFSLIKLALLLLVATATVERVFSAMKIIKSQLRNRLGDELMNDCLLAYIEKAILDSIEDEVVVQRFQNMKSRRVSL